MTTETWLEELAHELSSHGLGGEQVAAIVVEAECHLREAGHAPLPAFGTPAAYARQLAAALDHDASRSHRVGAVRVRATRVSKAYRRQPVLRDMTLQVHAGQTVLLIGPN